MPGQSTTWVCINQECITPVLLQYLRIQGISNGLAKHIAHGTDSTTQRVRGTIFARSHSLVRLITFRWIPRTLHPSGKEFCMCPSVETIRTASVPETISGSLSMALCTQVILE